MTEFSVKTLKELTRAPSGAIDSLLDHHQKQMITRARQGYYDYEAHFENPKQKRELNEAFSALGFKVDTNYIGYLKISWLFG